MKYLGLDLGSRTLGIATSDSMGLDCIKLWCYSSSEEYARLVKEVSDLVNELKIDAIVLGFPKNMKIRLVLRENLV